MESSHPSGPGAGEVEGSLHEIPLVETKTSNPIHNHTHTSSNSFSSNYYVVETLKVMDKSEVTRPPLRAMTWENMSIETEKGMRDLSAPIGPPTTASLFLGPLAAKVGLAPKPPQASGSVAAVRTHTVKGLTGYLLPGQMTLLLGPPGSGRTTLLRRLAGLVDGQGAMEGSLLVNGAPLNSQSGSRICAYISPEDPGLSPYLTAREVIRHGLECTTTTEYTRAILEKRVDMVLDATKLQHAADTVIGGEEVPGISEVDRRRIILGERVLGDHVSFLLADGITDGVDSTSAYRLAHGLGRACRSYGISAMVACSYPTPAQFEVFDQVMVLTPKGEVAYYGRRENAMSYFKAIGFECPEEVSEVEFLQQVTMNPEQFCAGSTTDMADPAFFPTRFSQSNSHTEAVAVVAEVNSCWKEAAAKHDPRWFTNNTDLPLFSQSFLWSTVICSKRQVMLLLRNPRTIQRSVFSILIGLILGSFFYQTNQVALESMIARCSAAYMFLYLAYLMCSGANYATFYSDRACFFAQRDRNYYRSTAYYLSLVVVHGFSELVLMVVFAGITIALIGSLGDAFVPILAVVLLSWCAQALARLFCYMIPHEHIAEYCHRALLALFTLTSCFNPQYASLGWWWRWCVWLNPVAYAFEAMLVSTYNGYTLQVMGQEVPANTIVSALFGIPRVKYQDAIGSMDTPLKLITFDLCMLLVLAIATDIIGSLFLLRSRQWYGHKVRRRVIYEVADPPKRVDRVHSPESKGDLKGGLQPAGNGALGECVSMQGPGPVPAATNGVTIALLDFGLEIDPPKQRKKKNSAPTPLPPTENDVERQPPSPLPTVRPLRRTTTANYGQIESPLPRLQAQMTGGYVVPTMHDTIVSQSDEGVTDASQPIGSGRVHVLAGLTAVFRPGRVTAIMGEEGSGKRTLLQVMAGINKDAYTNGQLSVNGSSELTPAQRKHLIGYCEESDIHQVTLTVKESIWFAVTCASRPESTEADREMHMMKIIDVLQLGPYENVIVGREEREEGLPKHARKRLSMGVALASDPAVLFLDEPITGLDFHSANLVASAVRNIADQLGLTVILTVERPPRTTFAAFDSLLVLRKGGRCVYFGPVGAGGSKVLEYVRNSCPNKTIIEDKSPSMQIMQALCHTASQSNDTASRYASSSLAAENRVEAENLSRNPIPMPETLGAHQPKISALSQVWLLLKRQLKAFYRTPAYIGGRLWWTMIAAVMLATVFVDLSNNLNGLFGRITALFFAINIAQAPMLATMTPLMQDRAVFYREAGTGMYTRWTYGLAMSLAELPFNWICAVLWFLLYYWPIGFQTGAGPTLMNLFYMVLAYWLIPSIGQLIALVSPNEGLARTIGSLLLIIGSLAMGPLLSIGAIPVWWKWSYWANPFMYLCQGLAINEFHGENFYVAIPAGTKTIPGDGALLLVGYSYDNKRLCTLVLVGMLLGVTVLKVAAAQFFVWKR